MLWHVRYPNQNLLPGYFPVAHSLDSCSRLFLQYRETTLGENPVIEQNTAFKRSHSLVTFDQFPASRLVSNARLEVSDCRPVMPGAEQKPDRRRQSACARTRSCVNCNALCHVFDTSIARDTDTRNNERDFITYFPFADGEIRPDIDEAIQQQHRLSMQDELRGWSAVELPQLAQEVDFRHSVAANQCLQS